MFELKETDKMFIFTGPDGSGRKTLSKMVASPFDMETVISYTTRPVKPFETEGEDYHFIDEKTFQQMIDNDEFLEHVRIDGYHYGIREEDIQHAFEKHKPVYLTLNAEGADLLKNLYGDNVVRIFIYADPDTVKQRQQQRGDDDETIRRHMNHYEEAIAYKDHCEHAFENYDLPQVSFQISELLEESYMERDLIEEEY